ncbi:OLC1v1018449C1 [Oldenlandia corymbosa var. corymbosa]|uniref:OLC1v1018449C1 n=1 Tax=Oldenlandia corymbosa var. corymbosa TaxID=529605 RepID=A0AAV1EBM6_OLDCO|nr:OLC1v1018449C1 [Oldenlandia corymbosa var. corymbosa]
MDGESGKQSKRIPQFFKFFDATKYSDHLHIPSAFVSLMGENKLPRSAFLRDEYGNKWPVELTRMESEWYFGEGWAKVAGDNRMEHCDFIAFQFDGIKTFHFKMIGNDSCSKVGVGSLKFLHLEDPESENDEDEEGGDELPQQFRDDDDEDDAEKKRGKATIDIYGAKMIQSGLFVQPRNPYFVTKIRTNRARELYIPADVVRDFKVNLPEKIALRDPAGRDHWEARLKTWKDGRTFYTGGWKKLCLANNIGDQDRCVCEFVKEEAGKLLLQIHIVRHPCRCGH